MLFFYQQHDVRKMVLEAFPCVLTFIEAERLSELIKVLPLLNSKVLLHKMLVFNYITYFFKFFMEAAFRLIPFGLCENTPLHQVYTHAKHYVKGHYILL